MSVAALLADLFEHGRVKVPQPRPALEREDLRQAERVLRQQEELCRLEFPGTPPEIFVPAAMWGATSYYRACQLAVYRDLDAGAIEELLAAECPAGDAAARHWSVDLVFSFLPDLVKHAAAASQEDPLVAKLRSWAGEWPLSSVGMPGVTALHEDEIAGHPGMLQLYVDRILAKKDWTRLGQPAVREAVRRSLGAHGSLWPDLTRILAAAEQPNSP